MTDVEVRHEPGADRYVGVRDDVRVGLVDYRREGDVLVVTHTETDPALQGQGIAAELTRSVLDDARRRGLRVRPQCPYTAAFLDRHPEYADLLA